MTLDKPATISFWISIFVLALKFAGYKYTGSSAVLSDALESIVNVISAIVAYFILKAVAKPADEDHPYGHGKLEYFSAAFEGGLITFASISILTESYRAFVNETPIKQVEAGLAFVLGATVINALLGLWLLRASKKNSSEALKASGWHILSDVLTSAGIFAGLIIYKFTGWLWIDSLLACLVAIWLLFTGYKIVRSSIRGLIDEKDPETLNSLTDALQKIRPDWMIDIHEVKIIRSGKFQHIDCHMILPEFWDVTEVHDKTKELEKKIETYYPYVTEIAVHADPCKKAYCENCKLSTCHIRMKKFDQLLPITDISKEKK